MWLLIMATVTTTSVIGEFKTEKACREEARAYRADPSPSRDVFYCERKVK